MFVPATLDIFNVKLLRLSVTEDQRNKIDWRKESYYRQLLHRVTDKDGVINGSELQYNIFPIESGEHFDVFISYSHNDEDEAYGLYQYLTDRGLHVFLDSTIWYSADKLQYEIDNQYSRLHPYTSLFDYEKTQLSSSHVHAMLSMAILEVIDRSELCIFLKSDQSLTLKDGIDNLTLSPWIYEELSFFTRVEVTTPPRFKNYQTKYFSSTDNRLGLIVEQKELKVQYKVDMKGLTPLDLKDLSYKSKGTAYLNDIYLSHGIMNYILND